MLAPLAQRFELTYEGYEALLLVLGEPLLPRAEGEVLAPQLRGHLVVLLVGELATEVVRPELAEPGVAAVEPAVVARGRGAVRELERRTELADVVVEACAKKDGRIVNFLSHFMHI